MNESELHMLASMLDLHVPIDLMTAVDAEETEQHDPVVVSMTHNSPSDVHWFRRPLHELDASPWHEEARVDWVNRSAATAEIRYMAGFVVDTIWLHKAKRILK